MRGRSQALFGVAALVLLLLLPSSAWACACCSNDGDYYVNTGRPSEHELSVLKQIRFGSAAHLYMTEGEADDMANGLAHRAEKYALDGSLVGRAWRLTFRDGDKMGMLNLPLPARMTSFAADIHDGRTSPGGGPLLYKEWRFEGRTGAGTGLFRAGLNAPAKYLLVLQGRGNGCQEAVDFTHWRLQVNGRKASFAFYGELGEPR